MVTVVSVWSKSLSVKQWNILFIITAVAPPNCTLLTILVWLMRQHCRRGSVCWEDGDCIVFFLPWSRDICSDNFVFLFPDCKKIAIFQHGEKNPTWYKHDHKKRGGRMDHRRESSTHRSYYCPGEEGLISSPAPRPVPTLCLTSCQLDPSWLRGEEDQDTQRAGQQQPLLPPALIFSHFGSQMQSRRRWWVGEARAALGSTASSTCTSSRGPRKKPQVCQWDFWNSIKCSMFSSVVQSVFKEVAVQSQRLVTHNCH